MPWFALVQDYIAGSSLQQLLTDGLRFTQAQAKQDDNVYAIYADTALPYKALSYAIAGKYDQAIEIAKTIKDDSSKKMALDVIARYRNSP